MKPLIFLPAILALSATLNAGSAAWATPNQPYAGQQTRTIKALSLKEIKGLETGAGLSMAKAAELNHYPGPAHIIQFAKKINLTKKQQQQVDALYQAMKAETISLGKKILAKEAALDRLFAIGNITKQSLKNHVMEIARLRGLLRTAHLKIHLKSKPLLTEHQRMLYDRLRGYGKTTKQHHGQGGH